jgi:hypothetical protein
MEEVIQTGLTLVDIMLHISSIALKVLNPNYSCNHKKGNTSETKLGMCILGANKGKTHE